MIAGVQLSTEGLTQFCVRNHIRKLSLFGSVLRGDFRPDSDVDLLVEFEPDHVPGLIRLAGMERELSEILHRKADLRTAQDLSRYMQKSDVTRLRHMLDAAREAVAFARTCCRIGANINGNRITILL